MSYVLGVDLGTTYSAAAVDADGRTEVFQLGSRTAVIPSVVVLRADGEVLTGETADRRSQTEPQRTAREFKRRLGDPTPLILGGTPYGAETVIGLLLSAIVRQVSEQRGEAPSLVCVTHPASYGPYKLDLLRQAVRSADIGESFFLSEPQAAALHYAGQERVEPGTVVAVYDFGGGTFDAAVLRKDETAFELLGEPEGLERLGGIDFDEAIFQHVARALDGKLEELEVNNPAAQAAVARLREECQRAKEALSEDTDAVIPVLLPNVQTDIRITRAEFEAIISPRIRETVTALQRSVRSAGLTMEQVDRILLVGGTSRIPLVGALVREMTGRPVAIDAHPKHAIALGAASAARAAHDSSATPAPATAAATVGAVPPAGEERPSAAPAPAAAPPVERPVASTNGSAGGGRETTVIEPTPAPGATPPSGGGGNGRWIGAGVAAVALVGAVGAFFALGGDGDDPAASASDPTATSPATESAAATNAAVETPEATPTATLSPDTSRITGIRVVGQHYEVAFETGGFEPVLPGQHLHFFFDTVPPEQAGLPADGPWVIYGGPSPFTDYGVANRPDGATRMCVLVANPDHTVNAGTGNCFLLPD